MLASDSYLAATTQNCSGPQLAMSRVTGGAQKRRKTNNGKARLPTNEASDPTLVVLVDVSHIQHEGHFSPTETLRSWTTGKRNAEKGPERRGGSRRVTAVASGGGDATDSLSLTHTHSQC
jgi:hypothetical protein